MTGKKASITSSELLPPYPLIHDALAATTAAYQIIGDLEAILNVIAKAAGEDVARLAAIGIRIASDARMDVLDDGHLKLRINVSERAV